MRVLFYRIFGELPRIILGKYTLYFLFLKSFDLLFFAVFCAKHPPPKFSFFTKRMEEYLGDSIIHRIVGITIFSKNTGKSISYSFLDKGAFGPGGASPPGTRIALERRRRRRAEGAHRVPKAPCT
jgi:hypothetical protein